MNEDQPVFVYLLTNFPEVLRDAGGMPPDLLLCKDESEARTKGLAVMNEWRESSQSDDEEDMPYVGVLFIYPDGQYNTKQFEYDEDELTPFEDEEENS